MHIGLLWPEPKEAIPDTLPAEKQDSAHDELELDSYSAISLGRGEADKTLVEDKGNQPRYQLKANQRPH